MHLKCKAIHVDCSSGETRTERYRLAGPTALHVRPRVRRTPARQPPARPSAARPLARSPARLPCGRTTRSRLNSRYHQALPAHGPHAETTPAPARLATANAPRTESIDDGRGGCSRGNARGGSRKEASVGPSGCSGRWARSGRHGRSEDENPRMATTTTMTSSIFRTSENCTRKAAMHADASTSKCGTLQSSRCATS